MLPFVFADPRAMLGIQPWGLWVVAGAWVGTLFAVRRARSLGYDVDQFTTALAWVVITGFLFGHWIDEVFYHPAFLAEHPASLLNPLEGQSSCGGFIGAGIGGLLWKHLDLQRHGLRVSLSRRPRPLRLLPYGEVITSTFPITWSFARLGCALVHDHPGRLAPPGSWFALAWPTGPNDGADHVFGPVHVVFGSTSRYDLGLLELVFTVIVALAFAATWRRRPRMGFYAAAVCLAYAPVRFALDFLRVTDVPEADRRYASLTFAQWFCLAMFAWGVVMVMRMSAGRLEPDAEAMAPLLRVPAARRVSPGDDAVPSLAAPP